MEAALTPPAQAWFLFVPTILFSILIPLTGIVVFSYIMARRAAPLVLSAPDNRLSHIPQRLLQVAKIWLGQWRHPRYRLAGILHIILFFGFLSLGISSFSMVIVGIFPNFVFPGLGGFLGDVYAVIKAYAATAVFATVVVAAIRRGIIRPDRYKVPAKYGKDHTAEAVFVLGLIATLMVTKSLYEGSLAAAEAQTGTPGHLLPPASLAWLFQQLMAQAPIDTLQTLHLLGYYLHDLTFFFFMCFLPLGKHFHVITSLFNVFFMRVERGNIKPVRHGVKAEDLDDLESFGIKKLEDFTWKHVLDFYSCADCGRCSDNCPANAVGRPLSPRFITIKGRDYTYKNYPLLPINAPFLKSRELMGTIYEEDEIWSCTTCGACEQECPLGIEYIDKIVDLRRGMVDDGAVPQSLQKPLRALEKRGNPWGKMEKKRADWAVKDKDFKALCDVKVLDKGQTAETLYFVDSISSYDDRMQSIAQASARVLDAAGIDFGILGKLEKDSGHEVLRFGEEMLYQDLKEQNTEAIAASGARRIVTADPHAYNALKHDYENLPPVEHISQVVTRCVTEGKLKLKPMAGNGKRYTYHDPCYLGRHNQLYEAPRSALDAIEGLTRVEMARCRDRSFCCGGGGLMLFYEPEEEQRMGVLRVQMAVEAGANVIVTGCPFCLVNIEDAIKVAGLDGEMEAIDLTELVAAQIDNGAESSAEPQ
jgi:Fe-S oxidoreductase